MSTDISQSIYLPSVRRCVDRHIGQVWVEVWADTAVEYRSRGAQNTHDPKNLEYCILVVMCFINFINFIPIMLVTHMKVSRQSPSLRLAN